MTSGPETGSENAPEGVRHQTEGNGEEAADVAVADAPEAAPDQADGPARDDGADRADDSSAGTDDEADRDPVGTSVDGAADEAADAASEAEPSLEQRLAAAEALADEHWNGRLRLQAELENQRKRALRDVQNARKFGLEPLLNDLMPTVDSLEMGLQASSAENATVESIREGMELTRKMLAGSLEKHGVVEVNPVGEKFDPEFHQAMSMQSVEGAAPNTVVQVLQKGYTLNDRLLRPALVMVAK